MTSLTVVAIAHAKLGKEAVLEKALREAIAPTHTEAGCLLYALHRDAQDPGTFVFVEKWTTKEALDAHLGSAHIAALFAKVPDLVEGEPRILVLDPLHDGDPRKGML